MYTRDDQLSPSVWSHTPLTTLPSHEGRCAAMPRLGLRQVREWDEGAPLSRVERSATISGAHAIGASIPLSSTPQPVYDPTHFRRRCAQPYSAPPFSLFPQPQTLSRSPSAFNHTLHSLVRNVFIYRLLLDRPLPIGPHVDARNKTYYSH